MLIINASFVKEASLCSIFQAFLAEENKGLLAPEEPATPTPKVPNTPKTTHGTPKAGTPHNRAPAVPASSPGTSTRSPQMIQFGKYDISTWYSSPYPQVRIYNLHLYHGMNLDPATRIQNRVHFMIWT